MQRAKVTRELDLDKRARVEGFRVLSKYANYTVDYRKNEDSGSTIVADNSQQGIYFTLPAVATANGRAYSFFNANTARMEIAAASNVIVDRIGADSLSVNYGILGSIQGAYCTFYSDGLKWLHIDKSPINSVAMVNIDVVTEVWPFVEG